MRTDDGLIQHRARRASIVAGVAMWIAVAACGGTPAAPTTPAVPATDAVTSITNMNPASGTVLQAGQSVTFSGTPGYTLASADFGLMYMVVQDQNDQPLQVSGVQPNIVVHRGDGDVTLTETIAVPATGVTSVRVYFALAAGAATTTNAAARATYLVR